VSAATKYGDGSTTCGSDDAGARHGGDGGTRMYGKPMIPTQHIVTWARALPPLSAAATQRRSVLASTAVPPLSTQRRRSHEWSHARKVPQRLDSVSGCRHIGPMCRRLPIGPIGPIVPALATDAVQALPIGPTKRRRGPTWPPAHRHGEHAGATPGFRRLNAPTVAVRGPGALNRRKCDNV
jgi:hypothetical protein